MRILLLSKILIKTGVGRHIQQLYGELTKQGHLVWVMSSNNLLGVAEDERNYRQVNLLSSSPLTIVKSLLYIHKFIVDNKIDIVHCHHRKAALIMRLYNMLWHVPVVYTLHLTPIPSDFIHRMMTWGGNCSIAISYEVAIFMEEKLGIKRIKKVLNGVDESRLSPPTDNEKKQLKVKFNIPDDSFVISMHGRICEVKNHIGVAKAMLSLPESIRKRIVVLCSGEKSGNYYHGLIDFINCNGLASNFRFCGWSESREVIGISKLLLFPSIKEGFGLNCIEALFLNVPILRTRTGGYHDMAKYVKLIESTRPDSIAEAIEWAFAHKEEMQIMAKDGFEYAKSNLTCHIMTRKTVDVYNSVING